MLKKILTLLRKEKANNDHFEHLSAAISDCGLWSWYTDDLPAVIQLEFFRAMLYIDPKTDTAPPGNQIALQFRNPLSFTILKKSDFSLGQDWLNDFHNDKLEPFDIDYDKFSFSAGQIYDIWRMASSTEHVFGKVVSTKQINSAPVKLGFWTSDVGVIILAEELKIYSQSGEISPAEVIVRHNKWWQYWKNYWSLIDSETPMPYDPLCEITIPATRENIQKVATNISNNKKG
jgi:hypothetical protein